mgnify:CR=1 FL=1
MTTEPQQFASDNYAGACPEALEAMLAANAGSAVAYGDDGWTQRASDSFRTLFETDAEVFFVFNGTAANSLALASLCQSYHSVICSSAAHVETDECGAPEFFSNGSKLLLAPSADGKLTPEAIRAAFQAHVRRFLPADCRVEFHDHGAGPASVMDISDPAFALAKDALSEEWGQEAAFIGAGGSIPIAGDFKQLLGMDSMLIGFARDDDRIHSPNEKYDVESFAKGARSWARILSALR